MVYLKDMDGWHLMKNKLYCNENIEFYYYPSSNKHDVIVTGDIKKDEIIEEAPVMLDATGETSFTDKTFRWPKDSDYPVCNVFTFGFGTIFRRTDNIDEANAKWENDLDHSTIIFTAIRDIKEGEFINVFDPTNTRYYNAIEWKNSQKVSQHDVKKNIRSFLDKMREED